MSETIPAPGANLIGGDVDAQLLLERVASGDREAFHAFYLRYGPLVMAVVRRKVREQRLAEELVQDIFVAAWLGAPGYNRRLGDPRAWLLGIARHKLLDHWRRMRRIATEVGLPSDMSEQKAGGPNSDLRLAVEQAFAKLSTEQRRVVDLIYRSGLTFREAARELKIPSGTVKSRVSAALSGMRAFLTASTTS